MRVAISSRDGISVNERFHRSLDYFVFEWDGQGLRFLERRPRPDVGAGDPARFHPDGRPFRDLDALAELLADCQHVVSLLFLGAARRALSGKGFAVHEARGPIAGVIPSILSQPPVPTGQADPVRDPGLESSR